MFGILIQWLYMLGIIKPGEFLTNAYITVVTCWPLIIKP